MLRATLAHLCPDAPRPTAGSVATALTVEQQLAFPRGFSSWGPEADVDPSAARKMGLSPKEVAFFKENGFIVRRRFSTRCPAGGRLEATACYACALRR
jgi:hypothetical protein